MREACICIEETVAAFGFNRQELCIREVGTTL